MLSKNEIPAVNLSFQIPGEKMTILSPLGKDVFSKCMVMIVPEGRLSQYQMIGLNLSPEDEERLFDIFDGSLHVRTYSEMERNIDSLKDRVAWLEGMLKEQEEGCEEDEEDWEEFDSLSDTRS